MYAEVALQSLSLNFITRSQCLQACADKLARELATYGCPPVFPSEEDTAAEAATAAAAAAEADAAAGPTDPTKFVAKKSKAAAKKGTGNTQWDILKMSGIPEEELPEVCVCMLW